MLKKMMALFVLACTLTSVAAVASPQLPLPPCFPCGGGGN